MEDNREMRLLRRGMRGCVVVLAGAIVTACAGSDEQRIARRLSELAETMSIEDRETPMIRQARARHVATLVAPDASVDLGPPFPPVRGHPEVVRLAAEVRVPAGGVAIALDGLRVTVDEPTRRALATVTAVVQAAPEVGGELLASRELDVVLGEVAGEWIVEGVRPTGPR